MALTMKKLKISKILATSIFVVLPPDTKHCSYSFNVDTVPAKPVTQYIASNRPGERYNIVHL